MEETIYAERGWREEAVALTEGHLWREDFTFPWYGRSYTLAYPEPQATNWRTDDIHLHVNKSDNLDRRIFLHDQHFYVPYGIAQSLPIKRQTLDSSLKGRFFISLEVTERREYNTPRDPCMEDSSYSFHTCIKESLSAKAGCRLPWDTLSSQDRPVCATIEQYGPIATAYMLLHDASMNMIANMTGCIKPCTYRDYKLLGGLESSAVWTEMHLTVELWMTTTEVTVETEVLLYPWQDLVADIGGTLGLFLGRVPKNLKVHPS